MKLPEWTEEDTDTVKAGCFFYIGLPIIIFLIIVFLGSIAETIEYIYHLFVQ
ncbi:MAG: hypothetical protein IKS45_11365 [Thermoguttaceae bacterium]|nr:hypothetical protein [Thermoguttaceae bacterium]MBR6437097.1 hypothetical protein [Thermoguttaceae bacterium]